MSKIIFMLLAFVPLGWHSPYLFQAWSSSRLDQYDWIFYLAAVPAAIWALQKEKSGKYDFYALFLLIPMLVLTAGETLHHINALLIMSAVVVIFSAIWLLWSWTTAYRVLPAAVILLLGTPSSSYQLSLLILSPVYLAWALKFLLAAGCFGWIWCNKRYGILIKRSTICFLAASMASTFLLLHSRELYFEGSSFIPELNGHCGDFWGRSILPDANTRRFFATSTVKQYRYTKNDIDISVLAVQCGKNIHEIHPASHCLRTGMWTVYSEKILYLQDNFAVTEIEAGKGSGHILVWVWYSSENFSTPGFLGFRRHFKPGGNYYTYQVSMPLTGTVENTREELKNFMLALRRRK